MLKFQKESHVHNHKKVGPCFKSYKSEPHVLIPKGGSHVVSGFYGGPHVQLFLKGSRVHNHKKVGPCSKSYKSEPHFLISKGGSHVVSGFYSGPHIQLF